MATASAARRPRPASGSSQPAWVWLAGAAVAAVLMLVAWFPFGALSKQRHELGAANAQLSKLKDETRALQGEQGRLKDPKELARIAREQYQLVNPGDRVVQVLPPTANQSALATGKQPFAGDPGLKPPVAPSAAGLLGDGVQAAAASQPTAKAKAKAAVRQPEGFWQRALRTLEFWR